ncbi:rhodanese-like domain-containing protein [Halococcus salsus]|uniref:rhodanese-like domain-containing protein n=1 Tax=Halococcus salsus TaxID=2162894 RepID=UPI0013580A03|nr:rhodanese-like domain-containing protein [Halococcus salsus]
MNADDDEITPTELDDLLETGDEVRVVDIRSPSAFDRGHIPGSENVPFDQIPRRAEEFADAERVVTVCPKGIASRQAMQLLQSSAAVEGRVESLAGGLTAWHDERSLEATETSDDGTSSDETTTSDAPF